MEASVHRKPNCLLLFWMTPVVLLLVLCPLLPSPFIALVQVCISRAHLQIQEVLPFNSYSFIFFLPSDIILLLISRIINFPALKMIYIFFCDFTEKNVISSVYRLIACVFFCFKSTPITFFPLQKWVLSIELSWSLFILSRNDGHLRSPKDPCCISGVDLSRSPFVIFLVWCELLLSNFHLRTFTLVFLCDACLLRTAFICCLHCFPCLHKENLKLPLHFQCPGTILGYWDCALWSLVYSGNPLGSVPYIITFLDFFNRNGTELQFLLLINVFV